MVSTFLLTWKGFFRTPGLLVWSLIFPILMTTLFMGMFSGLKGDLTWDPVPVAVVADDAYDASFFRDVVDELDEEGDDRVLVVSEVASESDGERLIREGSVFGMYVIDEDGDPALVVSAEGSAGDDTEASVNASILKSIADSYVQSAALTASIAETNPLAFLDADAIERAFEQSDSVEAVSLTRSAPDECVRYYYALLGMAAILAAQVAVYAITRTQANLSPVGARRALGRMGRSKTLAATFLASWSVCFLCLLAGFLYMRFVAGVDFAGREGVCIFGIAIATLFSTAFGSAFGAIPKLGEGAKSSIVAAVACALSFFAGLYGQATMRLADQMAAACPALSWLNPVSATANLFYDLYYYESLQPFFVQTLVLLAYAAVLIVIAAILMRRQRYESL